MITRDGKTIKIEDFLLIPIRVLEDRLMYFQTRPADVAQLHIEKCVIHRPSRDYPIIAEITKIKPSLYNRFLYLLTNDRVRLGDKIILDEIGDSHDS